jgi:hypothetical protein
MAVERVAGEAEAGHLQPKPMFARRAGSSMRRGMRERTAQAGQRAQL